jgi:hypothetical protein
MTGSVFPMLFQLLMPFHVITSAILFSTIFARPQVLGYIIRFCPFPMGGPVVSIQIFVLSRSTIGAYLAQQGLGVFLLMLAVNGKLCSILEMLGN